MKQRGERQIPVSIQVYLGSGKAAEKLRENLERRIPPRGSLSAVVVELLREADPALFKGVDSDFGR